MIKKIFSGLFKSKKPKKPINSVQRFNEALKPTKGLEVVYEEVNEYTIKGVRYKLGDKVICRSNECDPLLIGTLVEFWDNDGKWDTCIPQIKDEDGKVWGSMGILKPYSDELIEELKPMRPLEQWNYLLDDNVKEYYSYTEEQMKKKEEAYEKRKKFKENLV